MEQKKLTDSTNEFGMEELGEKNLKSKGKNNYALKMYERYSSYCETCPREKGKKCTCKW